MLPHLEWKNANLCVNILPMPDPPKSLGMRITNRESKTE